MYPYDAYRATSTLPTDLTDTELKHLSLLLLDAKTSVSGWARLRKGPTREF